MLVSLPYSPAVRRNDIHKEKTNSVGNRFMPTEIPQASGKGAKERENPMGWI